MLISAAKYTQGRKYRTVQDSWDKISQVINAVIQPILQNISIGSLNSSSGIFLSLNQNT